MSPIMFRRKALKKIKIRKSLLTNVHCTSRNSLCSQSVVAWRLWFSNFFVKPQSKRSGTSSAVDDPRRLTAIFDLMFPYQIRAISFLLPRVLQTVIAPYSRQWELLGDAELGDLSSCNHGTTRLVKLHCRSKRTYHVRRDIWGWQTLVNFSIHARISFVTEQIKQAPESIGVRPRMSSGERVGRYQLSL